MKGKQVIKYASRVLFILSGEYKRNASRLINRKKKEPYKIKETNTRPASITLLRLHLYSCCRLYRTLDKLPTYSDIHTFIHKD